MDCLWFSSNERSKGWDIQLYRLEYSSNIVQLQYSQHFALTAVGMGILSKKKNPSINIFGRNLFTIQYRLTLNCTNSNQNEWNISARVFKRRCSKTVNIKSSSTALQLLSQQGVFLTTGSPAVALDKPVN